MLAARLLPVSCTFSALTTTMLSPQSMCGVKLGLCLPRRRMAMIVASRPSTSPSASISTHFLSISASLAEKVFITDGLSKARGQRRGAQGLRDHPHAVKRFSLRKQSPLGRGIIVPHDEADRPKPYLPTAAQNPPITSNANNIVIYHGTAHSISGRENRGEK